LDAILGFEFETNKEPFACDILMESIFACSFEIIQSFIKGRYDRIIYISVVGGIGVLFCTTSYFFDYKPDALMTPDRTRIHRKSFILNKAIQDHNDYSDPNNYLINEK